MNAHTKPKREALIALLAPDDRVLAEGSVHGGVPGDERRVADRQKLDYALVTPERLVWTHGRANNSSLRFDQIVEWGEAIGPGHRYALYLRHEPITALIWVPARRLFHWTWGNAEAEVTRRQSAIGFSRRDTDAAVALRERLEAFQRPSTFPLDSLPPPPDIEHRLLQQIRDARLGAEVLALSAGISMLIAIGMGILLTTFLGRTSP